MNTYYATTQLSKGPGDEEDEDDRDLDEPYKPHPDDKESTEHLG